MSDVCYTPLSLNLVGCLRQLPAQRSYYPVIVDGDIYLLKRVLSVGLVLPYFDSPISYGGQGDGSSI